MAYIVLLIGLIVSGLTSALIWTLCKSGRTKAAIVAMVVVPSLMASVWYFGF